jgi:Leucine-rich repeat (LRR) protein
MNEQVKEKIAEAARMGSKQLDLSNLGLTELPKEIGSLTNLQGLNLFRN